MPSLFAAVTDPTVPTTVPPATSGTTSGSNGAFAGGVGETIRGIVDNLGNNGYQTGIAIVATTIAVVAMLNIKAPKWVIAPVAIGAFWAGWLTWNTLSGQDNPLFPGDVSATKIWDVALAGDRGFLIVVTVACVAAIFVWRSSTALASRLMLMVGAVLGASFLYNLFESVRVS